MSNKALVFSSIGVSIGLVILAAVFSGGSGVPGDTSATGHSFGSSIARAQQAPDFSLQTLEGAAISLSEFKGEKPVVLDFWVTWCPNCRRDMPKLNRLYEKYKDQIEVIGINLQEPQGAISRFKKQFSIDFPIALDPHSQAARSYGIRYTNTHILINSQGEVVQVITGDINESHIQQLIEFENTTS